MMQRRPIFCSRIGLLLTFALFAAGAWAENLPDPTRPSGMSGAVGEQDYAATGPVLQSVLNSHARKLAIISGKTVKQGDRVGEARVVKISDTEVVLAQGSELKVLRLFTGVEKQPSGVSADSKRHTAEVKR